MELATTKVKRHFLLKKKSANATVLGVQCVERASALLFSSENKPFPAKRKGQVLILTKGNNAAVKRELKNIVFPQTYLLDWTV